MMSWDEIFLPVDIGAVLARRSIDWGMDGPLPYPMFTDDHECPSCVGTGLDVRFWNFKPMDPRTSDFDYACVVRLDCVWCGMVNIYSVPLVKEEYRDYVHGLPGLTAEGVIVYREQGMDMFIAAEMEELDENL